MHINNIPNDFKFMRKILINLVYAACTWTLSSFIFWVDWKKNSNRASPNNITWQRLMRKSKISFGVPRVSRAYCLVLAT
jgi:hypothetical protein